MRKKAIFHMDVQDNVIRVSVAELHGKSNLREKVNDFNFLIPYPILIIILFNVMFNFSSFY